MYNREIQRLITIFAQANGVHDWLNFLQPDEVQQVVDAAETIDRLRKTALERQQQKLS